MINMYIILAAETATGGHCNMVITLVIAIILIIIIVIIIVVVTIVITVSILTEAVVIIVTMGAINNQSNYSSTALNCHSTGGSRN